VPARQSHLPGSRRRGRAGSALPGRARRDRPAGGVQSHRRLPSGAPPLSRHDSLSHPRPTPRRAWSRRPAASVPPSEWTPYSLRGFAVGLQHLVPTLADGSAFENARQDTTRPTAVLQGLFVRRAQSREPFRVPGWGQCELDRQRTRRLNSESRSELVSGGQVERFRRTRDVLPCRGIVRSIRAASFPRPSDPQSHPRTHPRTSVVQHLRELGLIESTVSGGESTR
jgi:hypothetical protein